MERRTLLKSNLKSHRGTVLGVFVLILLVSLSLGTVLTVWNNSDRYVNSEMDRLGYGDLTAWVSGLSEAAPLAEEISALDVVDSVGVQSLIFSEYEIGNQESDSDHAGRNICIRFYGLHVWRSDRGLHYLSHCPQRRRYGLYRGRLF